MEDQSRQQYSSTDNMGKAAVENSSSGRGRGFGRKRIILPAILFLVIGAAVFLYWYIYLRGYVSTDDAYIDGHRMVISAKTLGRITQLNVDEGDTVQQGQLLVALDDSDLQADLARARTNIEFSKRSANLARVDLDLAKDDYTRAKAQFDDKIISVQQFDHAGKAVELARAKYDMAGAAVKKAEAELSVIETKLANTEIVAPSAGVVARRWVVSGDVVAPGEPILTTFDLQDLWVTANFEETKISSIRVGDPVQISVDSYSGHDFEGRVLLIGAATAAQFSLIPPNNASGNFTKVTQRVPVKISVKSKTQDPQAERISLIPGMSVVVKIEVKE